jgi:4-hydroxy-tetrahydrodipicolinate synthase
MTELDMPRAFAFSVTPFDDDDRLDEEMLRAHLRRLRDARVGVYLGGCGGGEGYSLSDAEHSRVMEIGVDELKGHVPVYAGSFEPRSAAQMLAYARVAVNAGVDAVQLYPVEGGHGMVPTPRELEAYFDEVISEVDAPIILASHVLAGYKLDIGMVDRLIRRYDGKVIAVNFVQKEPSYLIDMHDTFGDRVRIYSGGTQWAITNLGFGGWGFNSSETNVMPRTAMTVVEAFKRGDVATAVEAHSMMLRLTRVFSVLTPATPRPMKTILNLLGLPGGRLRKPYLTPEGEGLERMRRALEKFDILAIEKRFTDLGPSGVRATQTRTRTT